MLFSFSGKVFNRFENIWPQNKANEKDSIKKICWIHLVLKNFVTQKFRRKWFGFWVLVRNTKIMPLLFHNVLSKFLENTYSNLIFSQYNIFQKHSDFFFQSVFGSLLNNREKLQSNQVQHSLCWSSPCFSISLWTQLGPLQCFATYFRKSKEIVVLRPKFPGYVISCVSVVR